MADGQPQPSWSDGVPVCNPACSQLVNGVCSLLGTPPPDLCTPAIKILTAGIARFCAAFETPGQVVDLRGLYLEACTATGREPVDI
jgi:hypothetical protein